MRFYRMHDMDLLSLEQRGISLTQAVYKALDAFIKGESLKFELPPKDESKTFNKKRYYKILILDKTVDEDKIKFLEGFGKGGRNNFLKNLLRMYICRPYSEEFVKEDEFINELDEKSKIFISERVIDEIKEWKKRTHKRKNKLKDENIKDKDTKTNNTTIAANTKTDEDHKERIVTPEIRNDVEVEETNMSNKDYSEETSNHSISEDGNTSFNEITDSKDDDSMNEADMLRELMKIF